MQLFDRAFWSAIYQTIYDFHDPYFLSNIKFSVFMWLMGELGMPAMSWAIQFVFTLRFSWVQKLAEYLGLGRE